MCAYFSPSGAKMQGDLTENGGFRNGIRMIQWEQMLRRKRGSAVAERVDNYKIQAAQAKRLFLTYDQQELIRRCRLRFDEEYFYIRFLSDEYRIRRCSGDMQRLRRGEWVDGNSFNEVMVILDWLCDSRADRFITGRWINPVTHGHYFHGNLQENGDDPNAALVEARPSDFRRACIAMGGVEGPGADMAYALELVDGLRILVQFWHGDEEFKPRLRCLWDENAAMYLRYETTWYAIPLLMSRIRERMEES